jgi:outer membrane protein TolC
VTEAPSDNDTGAPLPEAGPAPSPEDVGPENTVTIDPNSLRDLLINQNNTLLQGLNNLHRSKDQLNLARANLLPSVNLGALLYSMANPVFLLSSVEFLLPFLVPGNWFEAFKQKDQFEADRVAYRLLRLNEYASAYSLYHGILLDQQVRSSEQNDVDDLRQVEQAVQIRDAIGTAAPGDLDNVRGQRIVAEVELSKIDGLLADEIAQIRQALALSIDKAIVLAPDEVEPSPLEKLSMTDAIKAVNERAPEFTQLYYLEKAAKWDKWSRIFGFVQSATTNVAIGANNSLSFSNLTGSVGFGFGFWYFPSLKLSDRNLREIQLREDELRQEFTRLIEASQQQFEQAERRVGLTAQSVQALQNVFQSKLIAYRVGTDSLLSVLDARARLREAQLELDRADADVNALRITLHRALITGQFDQIQSCIELPERLMRHHLFSKKPDPSEYPSNGCNKITIYGPDQDN